VFGLNVIFYVEMKDNLRNKTPKNKLIFLLFNPMTLKYKQSK